jgi:hypothetical protein
MRMGRPDVHKSRRQTQMAIRYSVVANSQVCNLTDDKAEVEMAGAWQESQFTVANRETLNE